MAQLPDFPSDPALLRKLERVGNPVGVAVALGDSAGCIEWVNGSFEQLTGYGAAELTGKRLELFRGLDIGEPALDYVMARFRRGEASRLEIRTVGSRRHPPRWLAIEVRPLGRDEGFVALVRDLSGQRRGTDSGGDGLSRSGAVEGRHTPSGRRLSGPLYMRPVDLSQMVMQSCELLEAAVSGRTLLDLDLAGNLPLVLADPARLREVAVGLVRRAAEALEGAPGGICVRTSLAHERGGGQGVVLEVRSARWGAERPDSSTFLPGDPAARELELAEVLASVEAHGGSISITSDPRAGTRVVLPVAPSAGE